LIHEADKGYGNACMRGFKEAEGKYLFLADGDGSYDFSQIPLFLEKLRQGYDMVIGNRFTGGMKTGSMPWHHRYIGNPVLSAFVRKFFGVKIKDVHCGARALSKEAFLKMDLRCDGMEFASEMIVQASRRGLKMGEVPVNYNERLGDSKLRSFRDGWRHLRFILLYSPLYLFFIPGILLFCAGIITMAILYLISPTILGIQLFVHPMFLSSAFIILGYQLVFFSFFAKIYAITHLGERSVVVERLFRAITLERAGLTGIAIGLLGIFIYAYIFKSWISSGFGSLDQIKNSIVALTLSVVGVQTIFSAFMLSMVGIRGEK
jgi:glycosyltransferase involved in cell wall biosynthesis